MRKLFVEAKKVVSMLKYYAVLLYESDKRYYLAYIIVMFKNSFIPIINVLLGKQIISTLLSQKTREFLVTVVVLLSIDLCFQILSNKAVAFMNVCYSKLQIYFEKEIGNKVLSISYETVETAEFQAKLALAKMGISWYSGGIAGVAQNVELLLSGIITLIGMLTIFALLSPIVLLVIVFMSLLNILITGKAQSRDTRFRKGLVNVNRKLSYYLNVFKDIQLAKDIRLYNAGELIETRVNAFIDEEWKTERTRTKFGNKIRALIETVSYINQSVLYLYFAYQVITKSIDISTFSMLLSAGVLFYSCITSIATQVIELEKNYSFMREYMDFMKLQADNASKRSSRKLSSIQTIEFDNVSFKYPQSQHEAIKNVSVKFSIGEKVALVGKNGSGKSTFIKLLCRLYEPSEGRILINGIPINEYEINEYRDTITTVFQDFILLPFSIYENISAGNYTAEKVNSALELVGLNDVFKKNGINLSDVIGKQFNVDGIEFSLGEMQKIAIARALLKDSLIFLFDEPTASLDPIAEYEIFKLMYDTTVERTVFMVSHRLYSCRMCKRILLFDEGRIIADGEHIDLLENPLYKEMWNAQAQFYMALQ